MCEMNSNNDGRDEALPRRSSQSAESECPFCGGENSVFDEILRDKMNDVARDVETRHDAPAVGGHLKDIMDFKGNKGVKVVEYDNLEDEDIEEIIEETPVAIVMMGMN